MAKVSSTTTMDPELLKLLTGAIGDASYWTAGILPYEGGTPPTSFSAPRTDAVNNFLKTAQNPTITSDDFHRIGSGFISGLPQVGWYSMPGEQASVADYGAAPTVGASRGLDYMKDYESKYTQDVVDATIGDLSAQRGKLQVQNDMAQAAAGAGGDYRHGIRDAELQGDYLRNVASTTAGLRDQGFSRALGAGMADSDRKLSADTTTAGIAANRLANIFAANNAMADANANRAQSANDFWSTGNYNAGVTNANLTQNAQAMQFDALNAGARQDLANTAMLGTAADMDQGIAQQQAEDPLKAIMLRLQAAGLVPNLTTTTEKSKPGMFDWVSMIANAGSTLAGVLDKKK